MIKSTEKILSRKKLDDALREKIEEVHDNIEMLIGEAAGEYECTNNAIKSLEELIEAIDQLLEENKG